MEITKQSINDRFILAVELLVNNKFVQSKKEISESLELKGSKLSEILSSRMHATTEVLANFCVMYEINIDWIFTGRGNMLKSESEVFEKKTQQKVKNEDTTLALPHKTKQKEYIHPNIPHLITSEPSQGYTSENIISIPIVDVSAAAGYGYFNSDHPEALGELSFPANFLQKRYGNYYCGRVDGESMEPTLLYGDFIIFRLLSPGEWGDLKDGNVYFIVDRSGASFVKRIKNQLKKDGIIVCQSDNQDKRHRDFSIYNDNIANIYHVEWRFSNDMTNISQMYFSKIDAMEDRLKNIEVALKNKS